MCGVAQAFFLSAFPSQWFLGENAGFSFKSVEVLRTLSIPYDAIWMIVEDMVLSEIHSHKMTQTVWLCLAESSQTERERTGVERF